MLLAKNYRRGSADVYVFVFQGMQRESRRAMVFRQQRKCLHGYSALSGSFVGQSASKNLPRFLLRILRPMVVGSRRGYRGSSDNNQQ
jgi:hypothetical protein